MNHLTPTVLSNNPARGRCTFYARYAEELSRSFGLEAQTIDPDDGHDHSTPGLWIDGLPLASVIIAPNDIYNSIKQLWLEITDLSGSPDRLGYPIEETMGEV